MAHIEQASHHTAPYHRIFTYPQQNWLQLYGAAPKGLEYHHGKDVVGRYYDGNEHGWHGDLVTAKDIGGHRNADYDEIAAVNGMNHGTSLPVVLYQRAYYHGSNGRCGQYSHQTEQHQPGLEGHVKVGLIHVLKQEAKEENLKNQLVDILDFLQGQKVHFLYQKPYQNQYGDWQHRLGGNDKISIHGSLFYKRPIETGEGGKIIINGFGPTDKFNTAVFL